LVAFINSIFEKFQFKISSFKIGIRTIRLLGKSS